MKLHELLITTQIAREGMKVREIFRMCLDASVPAVPVMDHGGAVIGYAGFSNVMQKGCLPDYMIELAPVLGNDLSCIDDAEHRIHGMLESPVDHYVTRPIRTLNSDAPVIKALAIMQKYHSSFVFVFDGDVYKGMVTTWGIARRMIEIDERNGEICL
jgi:CBS domain-containing protein